MTPLAQKIVKDFIKGASKRTFRDFNNIVTNSLLGDAHFFECSAVAEIAFTLLLSMNGDGFFRNIPDTARFLPAPITWIEYLSKGRRRAYLIIERNPEDFEDIPINGECWEVILCSEKNAFPTILIDMVRNSRPDVYEHPMFLPWCDEAAMEDERLDVIVLQDIISLLSLINERRIVRRKTHMPHAGLQRQIANNKGLVGKFPLRAWTEIVLPVGSPLLDRGPPKETRLSGHRCLHYVRAHLQCYFGKLVIVRGYWRGDPALGMKRSHYRLTAPGESTHV